MEKKKCPKCGEETAQVKSGFTPNGSQKYKCKACGKVYTPEPKKSGYSEEEKNMAIKYYYEGNSGRSTGRFFNMSKANAVRWNTDRRSVRERAEREKSTPETPTETCEVEEMDEIYIHIGSKKTKPM